MKYSFDHNIDPSFYLWLDNLVIEKGEGFGYYSGALRKVTSPVSGFTSYAVPHRQLVYDFSVSGAAVPSGFYSGSAFVPTGAGAKVDYYNGQLLISGTAAGNMSMAYYYKEFNIYFTSSSETEVLFENKFSTAPRFQPAFTGFSPRDVTYPCIFIKSSVGDNTQLCFGGETSTLLPVRLTVLAENAYQYKAVTSLLRDSARGFIPVLNPSEMPFDTTYSLKSGKFDYSSLVSTVQTDCTRLAFIKSVRVSDFSDKVNSAVGPRVVGGFVDVDLELLRTLPV